jgi:hypothetical protein
MQPLIGFLKVHSVSRMRMPTKKTCQGEFIMIEISFNSMIQFFHLEKLSKIMLN